MTFAASRVLAETSAARDASPITFLLYVGTYTGHGNNGIYAFHFTTTNGDVEPLGLAAEAVNPSASRSLLQLGNIATFPGYSLYDRRVRSPTAWTVRF